MGTGCGREQQVNPRIHSPLLPLVGAERPGRGPLRSPAAPLPLAPAILGSEAPHCWPRPHLLTSSAGASC